MKKCIKCGVEIPEGRVKALPGVKTCVNHSSAEKLIGVSISLGEGDHNYNELMIMTPDCPATKFVGFASVLFPPKVTVKLLFKAKFGVIVAPSVRVDMLPICAPEKVLVAPVWA
mgnify:CR=1 FL=1